jgi:hypothetical protein
VKILQPTRDSERLVRREIKSLPDSWFLLLRPEDPEWPLTGPRQPTNVWKNRHFLVQLFEFEAVPRLSVQRTGANAAIRPANRDLRPISWDELMQVKRHVGFASRWAVEIYPPESQVVDDAPMRHLWLLTEAPAFGWRRGTEVTQ